MKVAILAGGLGTRLSEETKLIPKPMVRIGNRPIIWHIMNIYSEFGFNEFIILVGYKSEVIKEYFANYLLKDNDFTIDLNDGSIEFLNKTKKNWKITFIETGHNTNTGGRLARAREYLKGDDFMFTYGDGLANVNIKDLISYHNSHNGLVTMTSIQMQSRFGIINFNENNKIENFKEKPKNSQSWINGGFFVCNPKVLDYIESDEIAFENEPLEKIAYEGNLYGFKHDGFWKCMDTMRDKIELNDLIKEKTIPWRKFDK